MADFVVTASVFAFEGFISESLMKVVVLYREIFLLSENRESTNTQVLQSKTLELGKLMESHLPADCRPITSHKVFVHFAESVKYTGNLSECNGQWIEDDIGIHVEAIRRRGIKVAVESVLMNSISRLQALQRNDSTLQAVLKSMDEFSPPKPRDARYWDSGETGAQFLGRGTSTLLTTEQREGIAFLLGLEGIHVEKKEVPMEVLEFKRASFNNREYHSDQRKSKSSESSFIAIDFQDKEYYGQIANLWKVNVQGEQHRIAHLRLHYNQGKSKAGIPRVHCNQYYKSGNFVFLESIKRRTLFVRRHETDTFYSVLDVRADM